MRGFEIGQMVRLKPSITSRPNYFHSGGRMDWMLSGAAFKIENFDTDVERGKVYAMTRDDMHDVWYVLVEDIVPMIIDNRRIANV